MRRFKFKNCWSDAGHTLIEVIIGLAIMIGLALTSMRLMQFTTEAKIRLAAKRELLTLHRKVRLLIENKQACDRSLSGLTFRGSGIPQLPTSIDDLDYANEPLHNINLRYLNSDGTDSSPIYSHDPNDLNASGKPLNKFGPVEVVATELIMPEHLTGTDFPVTAPNLEIVPATIAVHSETKFTRGRRLRNSVQRFRVKLAIRTDSAGLSRVIACGADSLESRTIFYNSFSSEVTNAPVGGALNSRFSFCGFMNHYHHPDQYNVSMNAHTSETRCKLTPSGAGPLFDWTITVVAKDGYTLCEVVCL